MVSILEGICPECRTHYYGWSLTNCTEQRCERCGASLEIYKGGVRIDTGYYIRKETMIETRDSSPGLEITAATGNTISKESPTAENARGLKDMQNIAVNISMDSQVLSGTVTLPEGRRLTDFLNGNFPGPGESGTSPFLKLTGVNIFHKNGRKETSDTIFVNRQAIKLLRTMGKDDGRGKIQKTRELPYVPKQPLKAAIYTQDYELIGFLYCREKQDISTTLAQKQAFLPCTDVRIHDFHTNTWDDAEFVAVNTSLVFSVTQRS